MDILVVDDERKEVRMGEPGNIVLGRPKMPSALIVAWGSQKRFEQ